MAVTLKQIAEKTGLSKPTVSQILNGKGLYSEDSRRRVWKAARELGYRTNAAARAVSTGTFGMVSLLLSTEKNRSTLPSLLLDGIQDELSERELHLNVAKLPDEQPTNDGFVPKILREWMADGLLIDYTDRIPRRMIELLREHNIPSIWVNSRQAADCVHPDDLAAGRRATEHLLSLGHRRIAFVDTSHPQDRMDIAHYSAQDRADGYAAAMKAAGQTPHVHRRDVSDPDYSRRQWTLSWLAGPDAPTAAVAYAVPCAVTVAWTLLGEGRQVGRDFSLIPMADTPGRLADIRFVTMIVPQHDMGQAAVRRLMEKISEPAKELQPLAIPFEQSKGNSVAPPAE